MGWTRLAVANWASGDTWSTPTFTAHEYIHIEAFYSIASGASDPVVTFNDDDGTDDNYGSVRNQDGHQDETVEADVPYLIKN